MKATQERVHPYLLLDQAVDLVVESIAEDVTEGRGFRSLRFRTSGSGKTEVIPIDQGSDACAEAVASLMGGLAKSHQFEWAATTVEIEAESAEAVSATIVTRWYIAELVVKVDREEDTIELLPIEVLESRPLPKWARIENGRLAAPARGCLEVH